LVKKIKEQGFLRKSHQKTYPLDPGSGKNSSRIRIPDPGGKKASDPGSGSATLVGTERLFWSYYITGTAAAARHSFIGKKFYIVVN
jgi:hypothetical protein